MKQKNLTSTTMTTNFTTKDSGQRQEFETGAKRDIQVGKPRPDLISPHALLRLGALMGRGADKYGERNWEKGMPYSRFYASAMRHMLQWGKGDRDEDHLAAVCFNLMAIMHFEESSDGRLNDMIPNHCEPDCCHLRSCQNGCGTRCQKPY